MGPTRRAALALVPHSRSLGIARAREVRASADRYVQLTATHTDPFFPDQWYLENVGQTVDGHTGTAGDDIRAEEAWELATGAGQTVAVVDTGMQPDQPDLAGALWTNPGELPDNGLDDDADGLVDDVNGWSFARNSPDFSDLDGHGTVVAGEIAASADNDYGIVGLAYGAKLMPLQVGKSEAVNVLYASKAFQYAAEHGAVAANASFGGPTYFPALEAAVASSPQTLFVVAAGNNGADDDHYPFYPCDYRELNLICVAATDSNDDLASFSNYGARSVDLAAPGTAIASDFKGSLLAEADGTSMAAPLVTATAALVAERFPGYDSLQIRQKIIHSVDRLPTLSGTVVSSGRLDAFAALQPADGLLPETSFPKQGHVYTGRWGKVRMRIDQPGSIEECKLQGKGSWVGCADGDVITVDTELLKEGHYRLLARAIGTDGEAERRPAVFHFRVIRTRHR